MSLLNAFFGGEKKKCKKEDKIKEEKERKLGVIERAKTRVKERNDKKNKKSGWSWWWIVLIIIIIVIVLAIIVYFLFWYGADSNESKRDAIKCQGPKDIYETMRNPNNILSSDYDTFSGSYSEGSYIV